MSLTKRERAAVLRACEYLETGAYDYSCHALEFAGGLKHGYKLVLKFSAFYDKKAFGFWNDWNWTDLTSQRIMCLLWFLQCDGEIEI